VYRPIAWSRGVSSFAIVVFPALGSPVSQMQNPRSFIVRIAAAGPTHPPLRTLREAPVAVGRPDGYVAPAPSSAKSRS
jgi:hypothetical protein